MTSQVVFQLQDHQLSRNGKVVLSIKSLKINDGEKVALLGKSGAGKSTLLSSLRVQRSDSALCPQQLGLVPALSVYHNIYMGGLERYSNFTNLLNLVLPRKESKTAISTLCEKLGLEEKLFTSVDKLSGGQQQRTALGRAIFQQSEIFLGDEPVSALDTQQAADLLSLLGENHQTMVVALHDRQLALNYFDRIIGIRAGEIVLDSPRQRISENQLADLYRD